MSKPVVAVVYSESEGGSLESKHMGLYIGAHVAATGGLKGLLCIL